jgi:hypothetical protein
MRKFMVLVGSLFVLLGIAAESLYVISARVAYSGVSISANTYMITGLFLLIVGLILTLSGARIPKIRVSQF